MANGRLFAGCRRRWRGERSELFEHVIDGLDQLGAVANQAVTAPRRAAIDAAGNGKDFAALFHGVASRDERARAIGSLDDDHTEGESGDNSVSLRKCA